MVDFYARYISTSSSKRSKLSVHLQAQSKPKEPTLDEKKASAIAALQVIFTEHKIEPKTEELQTRINSTSSADAIPKTISTYLSSVLELKKEVADKVLDEIKAALGVADSGLPAEPGVLNKTADVQSVTDASRPVIIKDIYRSARVYVQSGIWRNSWRLRRNYEFLNSRFTRRGFLMTGEEVGWFDTHLQPNPRNGHNA
jgi:insulysin